MYGYISTSTLFIFFVIFCGCIKTYELRQERATVKYYNRKYVENMSVFTFRRSRGEPYRTNITFTTLHPWGNNVTAIYQTHGGGSDITLDFKMCDLMQWNWSIDFIKAYSNYTVACPVPAGTFRAYNIELPPKGFPLPLVKGDTPFNVKQYLTHTKELISHVFMKLHMQ